MAKRANFTFYNSFRESAEGLDGLARLDFYEAVISFALDGKEPRFSDKVARALFAGIRPNLEKGWRQYENGLKGGAPEGNTNAQKTTQKQPENNPNSNHALDNNNNNNNKSNNKIQETNTNTHSASEVPPAREESRGGGGEGVSFSNGGRVPSLQEYLKYCREILLPYEFAISLWEEMEAAGWAYDKDGERKEVRIWKNFVQYRAKRSEVRPATLQEIESASKAMLQEYRKNPEWVDINKFIYLFGREPNGYDSYQ